MPWQSQSLSEVIPFPCGHNSSCPTRPCTSLDIGRHQHTGIHEPLLQHYVAAGELRSRLATPISRLLLALTATAICLGCAAARGARRGGGARLLPLAEVAVVAVGTVLAAFALGGILAGRAAAERMASRAEGLAKGIKHAGSLLWCIRWWQVRIDLLHLLDI